MASEDLSQECGQTKNVQVRTWWSSNHLQSASLAMSRSLLCIIDIRTVRSNSEEEPVYPWSGKLAQEKRELTETKNAQEMYNSLREMYTAMRNALDAYLPQLREQLLILRDAQKKASKTASERPMLVVGVAFVLGLALGMALSRRKE